MAKKVRTPPPPRVQAPKVRSGRERGRAAAPPPLKERINWSYVGIGLAIVVAAGALVGILATRSSSSGPPRIGVSIGNMATLPGIQLGKPPWKRGQTKIEQRLAVLGIPLLGGEALQVHYHQHLDLYDDGKPVTVPQGIGFNIQGGQVRSLALLHTHDASGIVHVESPTKYDYTLGQFFGVWGVRLSRTCIGGLCSSKPLHVWVNGKPFLGDPTRLVLAERQEIAIAYGTPPQKIPSHYSFPQGL